jgi:hypothetical protein
MFERFVLPDLETCCAAIDYALYHMDGKGQLVHVDSILLLTDLRGIQWVPGYGKPPAKSGCLCLKSSERQESCAR